MSKTNILIIEDNPADIALIEAYLKDGAMKHTLFKSNALRDGLDFLKENREEVDLVLLDLKLVDVEGFKTLQVFRQNAPDIPVIVLTGFKNEVMGIQSVRAGAQDFLVKGDFDSKSLVRTIKYSLQRFEAQAKLQEKARELSQNVRRNQLAHQIARFGRWEMDIVDNAMRWDAEVFRFFGFQHNSFEPSLSDYLKYVHVEDKERVEDFFEQAIKDGQSHHIEHRIVLDNTNVRHFQINAQVNYDDTSNRILLVGGVQDITELRVQPIVEEVKEKLLPFIASDFQEDMLSQFNYNIRTPFFSMVNLVYVMDQTPLTDQQREYMEGFKSAMDELFFALNNWLNLSILREQYSEVHPTNFNLQQLLKSQAKLAKIRAENINCKFVFDKTEELPEQIIADYQKLAQAIANMIETGFRFGKDAGKIRFRVNILSRSNNQCLLAFKLIFKNASFSGDYMNELIVKLLKNNEELNDIKKGYLPLVITSKIAGLLDGNLKVQATDLGEYEVTFIISVVLPRESMQIMPEKPLKPIQLLLVEDHALNRLATKRTLTKWSELVKVDTAENGKVAYEKILKKNYDIILMDIQMPVMNGIEAALKIKAKTNIPIIGMTASESKHEKDRCLLIGMMDYIVKPIKPEDLFSKIMRYLAVKN